MLQWDAQDCAVANTLCKGVTHARAHARCDISLSLRVVTNAQLPNSGSIRIPITAFQEREKVSGPTKTSARTTVKEKKMPERF